MSDASPPSLPQLRQEIDRIDGEIHALLKERAQVVTDVARAKAATAGSGPPALAFRPGREASMLRALSAAHSGPFPVRSLVRIWREIISGMTQIQQDLTVAAHRPDSGDSAGWDAARDHFGMGMAYQAHRRARDVVVAVRDRRAHIGVVPAPGSEDDDEPWWPVLAADSDTIPRIVFKLPFLRPHSAEDGRAYVALTLPGPEPEPMETFYLAVEAAPGVSRERAGKALADAGVATRPLLRAPGVDGLYLAEAESGWPAAAVDSAIKRVTVIGGYPVPIAPAS